MHAMMLYTVQHFAGCKVWLFRLILQFEGKTQYKIANDIGIWDMTEKVTTMLLAVQYLKKKVLLMLLITCKSTWKS